MVTTSEPCFWPQFCCVCCSGCNSRGRRRRQAGHEILKDGRKRNYVPDMHTLIFLMDSIRGIRRRTKKLRVSEWASELYFTLRGCRCGGFNCWPLVPSHVCRQLCSRCSICLEAGISSVSERWVNEQWVSSCVCEWGGECVWVSLFTLCGWTGMNARVSTRVRKGGNTTATLKVGAKRHKTFQFSVFY